jgi:drug/metabolite transporter (DMT)-like permease
MAVFADKESSYAFRTLRGDAMMLVASVIWAVLAIIRKRVAQKKKAYWLMG